jgi:hypothetical protein
MYRYIRHTAKTDQKIRASCESVSNSSFSKKSSSSFSEIAFRSLKLFNVAKKTVSNWLTSAKAHVILVYLFPDDHCSLGFECLIYSK